jgi:hypothetical protein
MTEITGVVELQVSEPWDFVTACGGAPMRGTVERADSSEAVIRLERPVSYEGRDLHFATVRPRYEGHELDLQKAPVHVNATFREESSGKGVLAIGALRKSNLR